MEIDRVEEWRKLKEHYEEMTDEELEAVAQDGWELTDVALQALQGEVTSRGLKVKVAAAPTPPASPEPTEAAVGFAPADLDLVLAQTVWDLGGARRAKEVLNNAGIPSYLGPNNVEEVEELGLGFEGGLDVKVREVDQQRALQALAGAAPQESQSQPDYKPRCPRCHSAEIIFQGLEQAAGAAPDAEPVTGATTGSKFNWSCDACGYTWKDDGVEQEA